MSEFLIIKKEVLDDIGNSVREKTGKTSKLKPSHIAGEVRSLNVTNEEDVLRDLRGSLKTNIGYPADSTDNYDRMSLEQLIGKKQPDPGDGVVLGNDYNDGVFYKIRNELDSLYKLFQGDDEILSNSKERAFRSVEGIRSGLDNIKRKAVESLNAVLKPETPYDFDMPWTEITQLFNSLPSDVANIVTSSVDDNSSELREDVDNKIAALCRQYEVDVDILTGSWFATLENISILCEAINEKGNSQDSAWAEIIKENIENDTTFNLTLRSLWSLGTASNPLKLPYFKTDKAVFTMDTNSHPSNVEELGFDCSNISYVNGYIFASSPYLKKVILTGLDKRSKSTTTSGNFIGFFGSVKSLEEFYTDRICVINYAQTSLQNFFYNCSKLHTIGGFNAETRKIDDNLGQIDFTTVTSTANMFYNCQALQNVRFTEGTLTIGLDLSASPVLSKASVLSALYATAPIAEGATKPTIKFNAAIDDSDSDIQNAITYATNNGFIVSIGGNSYQ